MNKKESMAHGGKREGKLLLIEEYQITNREVMTELEKNCFANDICNNHFKDI